MLQKTIEEKLDTLLLYLKNNELNYVTINKPEAQIIEFDKNDRKNNIDFSGREICIEKIVKDGFASEGDNPSGKYVIKITIDGLLFFNSGGYVEKKRRLTISTYNQLIQSWAITIGTLLAGIYALSQMFEYFCNC